MGSGNMTSHSQYTAHSQYTGTAATRTVGSGYAASSSEEDEESRRIKAVQNEKTMENLRVRKRNPFGKLRYNAKKAVVQMYNITSDEVQLPRLEAWLEKKQSTVPYSWPKRWAMVRGSFLVWSSIQRVMHDPRDPEERKKFHFINLMQIVGVSPVEKGKRRRRFVIEVQGIKGSKKVYWRCVSKYDRDYWVKNLGLHMDHVRRMVKYLGASHAVSHSMSLPSAIMAHHELLV